MNAITPSKAADLTFPVEGMSCASCVRKVEQAAAAVPGVTHSAANFATGTLSLSVDERFCGDALIKAMRDSGYPVRPQTVEMAIEGLSCASCVARVEKALLAVPAVTETSVNLATGRAHVSVAGGERLWPVLSAAVERAGYHARHITAAGMQAQDVEGHHHDGELATLRRDVTIAGALTLPLFVVEMGGHAYPPFHHWLMGIVPSQVLDLAAFVLASLVLFGPGRRFLIAGSRALMRGAPDMNALVAIGTSAAWLYSVVATFVPQILPPEARHVYFEAAAVIVTLILVGRLLEARAKGRTGDAIRRLVGLQAKTARVVRAGTMLDLPADDVRVGDVLVIRPGEKIALDGIVREGEAYVDEAMISGEPVPVARRPGDPVIGGTIAASGSLRVEVTRVGADTVLSQIIALVQQAQGSKLPIQRLVDQVTAWFVPVVIAIAAITLAVWLVYGPTPALSFAVVNAVAVLIIACPCAMGLATPTSIMVGTGRAAELGVLFRKGEALQELRAASVIAFDKTGTLTRGQAALTDVVAVSGFGEDEVLAHAAGAEQDAEHPIARAIVAAASARGLIGPEVEAFSNRAGFGVAARVGGRPVEIGAAHYISSLGHDLSALEKTAGQLADQGRSAVYIAIDGRLAGLLAVADTAKPGSRATVAALRERGVRVVMMTGDNARTANAIAASLGIEEVMAELLPADKVEAVKSLRGEAGTVAFVGDGINDAPALAQADIGVAMGSGTDIAINSADVILVGGDPRALLDAITVSRATMRNIKQNLFWAFGYNVVLIPVAAGVLYPAFGILLSPMLAAGAMALSSVFVVANALRLRRFRTMRTAGAA